MVDDAEKPEIFVGTFMAMVHDGRACSLPGQVPKVYTNMDQAITYCRAKGPGWHCMTNANMPLLPFGVRQIVTTHAEITTTAAITVIRMKSATWNCRKRRTY